jgi:hypothetical protein
MTLDFQIKYNAAIASVCLSGALAAEACGPALDAALGTPTPRYVFEAVAAGVAGRAGGTALGGLIEKAFRRHREKAIGKRLERYQPRP